MENPNNRIKYPVVQTRVTPDLKEAIDTKIVELNKRPQSERKQKVTTSKVVNHFLKLFVKDGMELSPDSYMQVRAAVLHLAGVSRNLNQLTRKANSSGSLEVEKLNKRIDSLEHSVSHLRKSLTSMLQEQHSKSFIEFLEEPTDEQA